MPNLIRKNNKDLGAYGEKLAGLLLILKGYRVLYKNFRYKYGEIDIVCKKGKTIIFVEVKTRKNTKYISPKENIDLNKIKKISRTGELFCKKFALSDCDKRIDCIEVCLDNYIPIIRHLKNIDSQIYDLEIHKFRWYFK